MIANSSIFPTKQQAEQLKECSANGKLNQSYIYAVLLKKENSKINVTIPAKKIGNYFPETYSKEQIEEVIFMLLDKWKEDVYKRQIKSSVSTCSLEYCFLSGEGSRLFLA